LNAQKAYALIDDRSRIQSGAAQIFRTEDGGSTWQRTHTDDLHFLSRIGWYFADIYVNPQDDNEIFALGVRVAHSRDGGKTFELLAGTVTHITPSAASGLHLDHCEMWIDPDHPTHLVLGNDGGLYESRDSGNTWLHFNNLPTGEFYDVEIDQGPDYRVFAGAQDNATVVGRPTALGPSRTEPWRYLWIDPWNGGDGCVTRVDPDDPNTVYYSAQEGAFQRMDMTTGRSKSIRPQLVDGKDVELKFNFVAPMFISTHDPGTLFLGGNFLFESTDRGDHWNRCPKDFATDAAPDRITTGLTAIAESPSHTGRLWVGTDQGEVWFRSEPDSPWIHAGELPRGYIRSIVASEHSDSRVYVTLSGLNFDQLDSWVFCSDDHGQSWRSISSNISDEPVNVIVEDHTDDDVLYLGTFRGVYVTCNRGDSWQSLGQGLPACSIADIEIHRGSKDMIVATHGRGIFRMNLQPLQQAIRERFDDRNTSYLFTIPEGRLPYLTDVRPGDNFRPFPGSTSRFGYPSQDRYGWWC
jgi:photosystem II stability/assembly factor-like uncharacterized protein